MLATKELQAFVAAFSERRKAVTPEVRAEFMEPRSLIFKGMPEAKERKAGMESEIKALEEKLMRKKERLAGVEEELKA